MSDAITFDSRDLIGPPFRECPACHAVTFGVLSVSGRDYDRCCRECFTKASFSLWPLRKKVVYIDQFAISNMTKAINATIKGHTRAKADPFWLELFEALERVTKLQLVACPYSQVHREESLMVPFFAALRRMYRQLSHEVSFIDFEEILHGQVNVALLAWLQSAEPAYDFDPTSVIHGNLHEWHDRMIISVDVEYPDDLVESIRQFRDSLGAEAPAIDKYYRDSGQRAFKEWLKHERRNGSEGVLKAAIAYYRRIEDMRLRGVFDPDGLYSSKGWKTFQLICNVLTAQQVEPSQVRKTVSDFIMSDTFQDVPANHISAVMWAVVAHRASHGHGGVFNRGMFNDIDVVSTLLPYCDAMFVDNECAGLLRNVPNAHALDYSTRVFSPTTKQDFQSYLAQVEAEADPIVLSMSKDVYGDSWPQPFLSMYDESIPPDAVGR